MPAQLRQVKDIFLAALEKEDDAGVVLPADYTFTAADAGVHTFTGGVTLITPGDQTITGTDTASGMTRTATVTIVPPN